MTFQSVPPGGVSMLPDAFPFGFALVNPQAGDAGASNGAGGGPTPGAFVTILTIGKRASSPYAIQYTASVKGAVKKGDVLFLSFWIRANKGQAETGEGRTEVVFERGGEPYTKSLSTGIGIPRAWKRFEMPFTAVEDLEGGGAKVHFRLGYDPQVFSLAEIKLLNFGHRIDIQRLPRTRVSYAGRERTAPWRKDAARRIDAIRKAPIRVLVQDSRGRAVPGAKVDMVQEKHGFGVGSAVAGDFLLATGADGDRYREIIAKHFSRVVLENDLKWGVWEENPKRALDAIAWLRGNGIAVRGHNLIWPSWRNSPRDLEGLKNNPAALKKRIDEHFRDILGKTRGQLVEWDVVNETFDNHDVQDILGPGALPGWFRLAKQLDPKTPRVLNDYPPLDGGDSKNPHLNHFEKTIRSLKSAGAPLDGIGFQCHFGESAIPPTRLLSGLDRFGKLGLPIAITELDVNSKDDGYQADYLRDVCVAAFSHPSVNQIIFWGFWEGRHWLPDAALWRRDWSLKPAGKAFLDLWEKEFKTRATGETNASGAFVTRGFKGTYEIGATVGGKRVGKIVDLKNGGSVTIVV